MNSLMDDLGDLAGLDMVLVREAGRDREAPPVRDEPGARRAGWIDAITRRAAGLLGADEAARHSSAPRRSSRTGSGRDRAA